MTHDEECMRLGQEMLRVVKQVWELPAGEVYAVRTLVTKECSVFVFVVREPALAQFIDKTVCDNFDVTVITSGSGTVQ